MKKLSFLIVILLAVSLLFPYSKSEDLSQNNNIYAVQDNINKAVRLNNIGQEFHYYYDSQFNENTDKPGKNTYTFGDTYTAIMGLNNREFIKGHKYYIAFDAIQQSGTTVYLKIGSLRWPLIQQSFTGEKTFGYVLDYTSDTLHCEMLFIKDDGKITLSKIVIVDITNLFGSGKELSLEDCKECITFFQDELYYVPKEYTWQATAIKNGAGTVSNPYRITTPEELAGLETIARLGRTGVYAELGCDIDLAGKYWLPIGRRFEYPFNGYFNGNNHSIKNMTQHGSYAASGLFGVVKGNIEKVILENVYLISCSENTGAVVGKISGSVKNCIAMSGYIDARGGRVGGIIGLCDGGNGIEKNVNYLDIHNYTSFVRSRYLGGICGYVQNFQVYIYECINYGQILDTPNLGYTGQGVERSYAFAGGISGVCNYIKNSYSKTKIEGRYFDGWRAGGITGNGSVIDSYTEGPEIETGSGSAINCGLENSNNWDDQLWIKSDVINNGKPVPRWYYWQGMK